MSRKEDVVLRKLARFSLLTLRNHFLEYRMTDLRLTPCCFFLVGASGARAEVLRFLTFTSSSFDVFNAIISVR